MTLRQWKSNFKLYGVVMHSRSGRDLIVLCRSVLSGHFMVYRNELWKSTTHDAAEAKFLYHLECGKEYRR